MSLIVFDLLIFLDMRKINAFKEDKLNKINKKIGEKTSKLLNSIAIKRYAIELSKT